jgi:hypothetical protein
MTDLGQKEYHEYGRGDWTRTSDLVVPNDARYQLRHTPTHLSMIRTRGPDDKDARMHVVAYWR